MSALNSHEVAPVVFECDLDRDQAGIPPLYMPNVSGVLIANDQLLNSIGMVPGAPEPSGWSSAVPPIADINAFRLERMADFEKPSRDGNRVLRAKRFGQFWAPRRAIPKIPIASGINQWKPWLSAKRKCRFGFAPIRLQCDWLNFAILFRSRRWPPSGVQCSPAHEHKLPKSKTAKVPGSISPSPIERVCWMRNSLTVAR
jgi:hypothetical protein